MRLRMKLLVFSILALGINAKSVADPLPGPADIDRVFPDNKITFAPVESSESVKVKQEPQVDSKPPAGADKIKLILEGINIEGNTTIPQDQLDDIYSKYLGKEITLDKVWEIASRITTLYREKGYFLSRAYVPAQEVGSNKVTINIIEGYISEVKLDEKIANNYISRQVADNLIHQRPIQIGYVEQQLLLLNDIPGLSYHATMEPIQDSEENAVRMVIKAEEESGKGFISIDNTGSRFLGPYEAIFAWRGVILPMQETTMTAINSIPTSELTGVNLQQKIFLFPNTSVELSGGFSMSDPGYSLKEQDVESESVNLGIKLVHQVIRQRDENLLFKIGIDGRNTDTDIIGFPLTRDRVRAARISASYDGADSWNGYNYFNASISKGLNALGSNDKNDLYLSRLEVEPDFLKGEFSYTRLQNISSEWAAIFALGGQTASGSLYSSEEFGYGGQIFGRAYDLSEISGDEGIAASIEFDYKGFVTEDDFSFIPYIFYDIGKVWNDNPDQLASVSGSSAGVGVRIKLIEDVTANLAVAVPLTKDIENPLYGNSESAPRYIFQLTYSF